MNAVSTDEQIARIAHAVDNIARAMDTYSEKKVRFEQIERLITAIEKLADRSKK